MPNSLASQFEPFHITFYIFSNTVTLWNNDFCRGQQGKYCMHFIYVWMQTYTSMKRLYKIMCKLSWLSSQFLFEMSLWYLFWMCSLLTEPRVVLSPCWHLLHNTSGAKYICKKVSRLTSIINDEWFGLMLSEAF